MWCQLTLQSEILGHCEGMKNRDEEKWTYDDGLFLHALYPPRNTYNNFSTKCKKM